MFKNLKIIHKNFRRYRRNAYFRARFYYVKYYRKLPIRPDAVLVQSFDGTSISGNPYYILQELCARKKYRHLKKYVVAKAGQLEEIATFLAEKNFANTEVVILHSKKYCRLLAECRYLINNSTFAPYFIKKPGQVYLNTWHGTPLKTLGRRIADAPNEVGNSQRNLLMADFLLWPNRFTFETMRRDYMLDKFFCGQHLLTGYPRNTAFFDAKSRVKIRRELELEDKKVVVYMPTWRGVLNNKQNNKQNIYLLHTFYEITEKLGDDVVVFVKLHQFAGAGINLKDFKNIRPFPEEYETYEFLNIADVLVTDYSSVFFDFAVTGRKIILYGYDRDEYIQAKGGDEGLYLDYDKLPFALTRTPAELAAEINRSARPRPYRKFRETYNPWEGADVAKVLCNYVFAGKNSRRLTVVDGRSFHNGKPNVYLFGGGLLKNGITASLKGLLADLDYNRYNFVLTFYKSKVEANKMTIHEFNRVDYMPIQGPKVMTRTEAVLQFLYFKLNWRFVEPWLEPMFGRELKRLYPNIHFDFAVHFSCYERQISHHINAMRNCRKTIFIHNDMVQEYKTRKHNFHRNSLKLALEKFDHIACVRESLMANIQRFDQKLDPRKLCVVHNPNDLRSIRAKAEREPEFDADTACDFSPEEIGRILADKTALKFICVGRFSPEKGLDRLIRAFVKFRRSCPRSFLFIIGGHGISYPEIYELATAVGGGHVVVIKSLSNPYAILARSDCFVLSSRYEGLPMVLTEALILGKPIIATDIEGVHEFLSQGYGHLVANSERGLLAGMKDFATGKVKNLKAYDAEGWNRQALREFYELLR